MVNECPLVVSERNCMDRIRDNMIKQLNVFSIWIHCCIQYSNISDIAISTGYYFAKCMWKMMLYQTYSEL